MIRTILALAASLTFAGGAHATPSNLPASTRKIKASYQKAVEYSAKYYCLQKDKQVNEDKALKRAQAMFIRRFSMRTPTTVRQLVRAFQEKDFTNRYWQEFNYYAYDKCPEYYLHESEDASDLITKVD